MLSLFWSQIVAQSWGGGLETFGRRCGFESRLWELRERQNVFPRRNHHIPVEVFGSFDTRVWIRRNVFVAEHNFCIQSYSEPY